MGRDEARDTPETEAEHPGDASAAQRRVPVTTRALLDRDVTALSRAELAHGCLLALRALGTHDAAIDHALGRGLQRLTEELSFKTLCHSRLEDFAPARLGASWSHLKQLRQMAGWLAHLPLLRRASLCGDLGRGKLRVIGPVATPETEAGWLALAKRHSTRRLEELVAEFRRGRLDPSKLSDDPITMDKEDSEIRVSWQASAFDAALFRSWGRAMLRQLVGRGVKDWEIAEALAAETLTVLDEPSSGGPPMLDSRRTRPMPRPRAACPAALSVPVLEALGVRSRRAVRGEAVDLGLPDVEAPSDAWELVEVLGDCMSERHGLTSERASLLGLVHGVTGGHAPREIWRDERLLFRAPRLTPRWRPRRSQGTKGVRHEAARTGHLA